MPRLEMILGKEQARSKAAPRILVCGHDLKFLQPLMKRLQSSEAYEIKTLSHEGHYLRNHQAAQEALEWADLIFCEWALDNAVWFSQKKRPDQVLIVRLHLQEVQSRDRSDFIYATDWEKVDRLILITQHLYDWMRSEFPQLAAKATLVYNPIPASDTLNLPKLDEARHVLGFVGAVPARKRLDLAVAVLRKLRSHDQRYRLRIKGALPHDYPWMADRRDEMAWYNQVFNDLADLQQEGAIVFDPHGPDMASWYQEIGHILSVSDFEGSHQAVAEGMAAGCVPAIRDWVGAGRIYPAHYVEGTVDRLVAMIERHTTSETFERESSACRAYAASRFDETPVCDALLSIIDHELRRIRPKSAKIRPENAGARPTFLIIAYIPIGSRSGYRIRVEQEIQVLSQMGCIVHLACLLPPASSSQEDDTGMQQRRVAHITEFSALGAHVHLLEISDIFRLQVTPESFISTVADLAKIARSFQVDVLHAEALYCARVAALVKAQLPELSFSIDWHGVVPEESRMGGGHESRVKALESAEQALLASADLNVFVSEAMASHYQSKYALGTLPQVTVPCCVTDQRFVTKADVVENPFGAEDLVFAYAGSMADWQCGPEMIKLFAALQRQDARCRFLLLVPTADHEKVMHLANDSGLSSDAYILKSVAHDEVPGLLASAHIGVLLRRFDAVNYVSSPTKFGEYLAAGIPVLMTDAIGDYSALAERTGVGFVIPCTAIFGAKGDTVESSLLKQVIAFAQHASESRDTQMRHCQTVARRELHWEPAAAEWIEKYGNAAPEEACIQASHWQR